MAGPTSWAFPPSPPTVKRGYALADECRALGIPVILGGPHVTFLPDEALAHADLVVRGEGEQAMNALLDLWHAGYVKATGRGVCRGFPTSPGRMPPAPFTITPWHPGSPTWMGCPCRISPWPMGRRIAVFGGKNTVMVQTSRGCPFDCSFCSVTGMFGKKFRYRSVESVLQEVRRYNTPGPLCLLLRRQFHREQAPRPGAGRRDDSREKFRFQWSTQVRTDLARDPELVALMKRAGCHTVFIGFESVNPKSLTEMKKNQTLEEIRNAMRVVQDAGIHIHGMFVFGFEEDDWQTVEATVRLAREMKLTSVQLLILTPLPGSELYQRLAGEERLTSRDWDLYDTHHVVFRPDGLYALRAPVRAGVRAYAALHPSGRSEEARDRAAGGGQFVVLRLEDQPGLAEAESAVPARTGGRFAFRQR